jgi:aspartyl/asparaginyl beta-hydroxylase (cupin superfamily)
MSVAIATAKAAARRRIRFGRLAKKAIKRIVPLALGLYFVPWLFLAYVACGLIDVSRNTRRTLETVDRYFAGNGLWTWLLSPVNLLMDILSLPYWNKGIFRLTDLPAGHQQEIRDVIASAYERDVIGRIDERLGNHKRGMIFFKWYGKNIETSVDVPEFHKRFKYIRTIGVSVFNTRSSTAKHYGPLRLSFRVLYNLNRIEDPNAYIKVGRHIHRWCDDPLFIFDDTLQHQSCNETELVRYCLFVDIIRPTLIPWLFSGLLFVFRLVLAPFLPRFFKRWVMIK